ncbi:MAG: hypothetical protein RI573_15745, partial [Balneolaceae bacterium]|nr:hypothetical protein [Balneolaceae bacterium]
SDDFFSDSYYRQRLRDPEITPENFTVKVGDRWVATLQTREYAEIAFYNGFKEELPAVVSSVFPYKLFWNLIMGNSENYVAGLVHESFHALQGIRVPDRLSSAEYINSVESQYPWENEQNRQGWAQEADLLIKAYQSSSELETRELINRFLEVRENRRMNADLSAEEVRYEKEREWLEGMAKYAELKMGLIAAETTNYTPEPKFQDIDSDFNSYQSFESYFENQVAETKRAVAREGESRFYHTGLLQAMLLDRVRLGWKSRVFQEGVYLDNLLSNSARRHTD